MKETDNEQLEMSLSWTSARTGSACGVLLMGQKKMKTEKGNLSNVEVNGDLLEHSVFFTMES